jgi:5-methylcytosine-specific restriction endonuclease McrA
LFCLNCNKETNNPKYCNNACQTVFQCKDVVDDWLAGKDIGYRRGFVLKNPIRNYLLRKANYSCSECGWDKKNPITKRPPLEIDHIDGDCTNAKRENLRVLCPNCHSLTPTWKSLNRGKGNKERFEYLKQIFLRS